jgi:DNA-binding HxlR family transcriptional regulator
MVVEEHDPVLILLKVLADDSRLALLRLLKQREQTVGELAEQIGIGEPTVSHHLTRLRLSGMVSLRMAGNQRFYRLNEPGLERFKRLVMVMEQTPEPPTVEERDDRWIDALGWSAEDADVLREYTLNQRMTRIPSRQKKQIVIFRWLATLFEANRLYTEREVNAVLKSVSAPDIAGLRRDLIDFGYLRRERGGGQYWLTPADEQVAQPTEPAEDEDEA